MSTFELYLLLKLDGIVSLFIACAVIPGVVTLFMWINVLVMEFDDGAIRFAKRHSIKALIPALIFMVLAILTPSTKQMAVLMVVPPLIETVSNNEELKKLPDNIINLANEWLEELKPNGKDTQ